VTVLLPTDHVALYPPAGLDGHGWRLPAGDAAEPYWQGEGALQLQPGVSDPRAADGGGRGPHGPARDAVGQLFLPGSLPELADGYTARVRGETYVLSQTRRVLDPAGGDLGCWAAQATGTSRWPRGSDERA
jgi:hypothetical protein